MIISILKKKKKRYRNKSFLSVTLDIIPILPDSALKPCRMHLPNLCSILDWQCKGNNVWRTQSQSDGWQTASKKGLKDRGQKRQGGSKSPLKPKWVVLSLWGNRAVAKHSEREASEGSLFSLTAHQCGPYIHRMIFTQHWVYLEP